MDQTVAAPAPERPFRTLGIGVVLLAAIIGLAVVVARRSPPPLPVLGAVADFSLTNQLGQRITLEALRGKVWLADIIFTRCPGPCARMTRQLAEVQAALPARSAARLVSLTTDPEYDSPAVLGRYATHAQADPARWLFLTGDKLGIAGLAIDSLKLTTVAKPPEARTSADDLFIHSTIFVLVDQQARLRGIFETGGETVDWPAVRAQILAAIQQLERER
jgi:protein SCO1/2